MSLQAISWRKVRRLNARLGLTGDKRYIWASVDHDGVWWTVLRSDGALRQINIRTLEVIEYPPGHTTTTATIWRTFLVRNAEEAQLLGELFRRDRSGL